MAQFARAHRSKRDCIAGILQRRNILSSSERKRKRERERERERGGRERADREHALCENSLRRNERVLVVSYRKRCNFFALNVIAGTLFYENISTSYANYVCI